MTQQEFFSKCSTDQLLSMRFIQYCGCPVNEGDKGYTTDSSVLFEINKDLLYKELSLRPHRVRAKDRRKKK